MAFSRMWNFLTTYSVERWLFSYKITREPLVIVTIGDTFLVLYLCERRRLWIRLSIGDIAQAQYVADALVPLPRIVPVEGCDGQRINESFITPQYISLATIQRCQYKAKVNIKRDTRESVPFGSGRNYCLHFISVIADPRAYFWTVLWTWWSQFIQRFTKCMNDIT